MKDLIEELEHAVQQYDGSDHWRQVELSLHVGDMREALEVLRFMAKFRHKLGTHLKKKSGSEWEGKIVGVYSTDLTAEGYAIESKDHKGSVQIYPVSALEVVK